MGVKTAGNRHSVQGNSGKSGYFGTSHGGLVPPITLSLPNRAPSSAGYLFG
jgi:hypothetical protein